MKKLEKIKKFESIKTFIFSRKLFFLLKIEGLNSNNNIVLREVFNGNSIHLKAVPNYILRKIFNKDFTGSFFILSSDNNVFPYVKYLIKNLNEFFFKVHYICAVHSNEINNFVFNFNLIGNNLNETLGNSLKIKVPKFSLT